MDLLVQLRDKLAPVLEADFEDLSLSDLRNLDKVKMGVEEDILVLWILDKTKVGVQEVGEEQGKVENQFLLGIAAGLVCSCDIYQSKQCQHQSKETT